jgi:hypothetical protein
MAPRAIAVVAAATLALLALATTGDALLPRQIAPAFKATAVINEKCAALACARTSSRSESETAVGVRRDRFQKIALKDYLGKWVVLLFYPFDFTFVCPTEIISFADHIKDFHDIDAEVLAISTDSHHTHLAWVRTARSQGACTEASLCRCVPACMRLTAELRRWARQHQDPPRGRHFQDNFEGVWLRMLLEGAWGACATRYATVTNALRRVDAELRRARGRRE